MIGLRKIKCFFVHPSTTKVMDAIEDEFDKTIGLLHLYNTRLKIHMCEALKEETEE